jgi:hypothetical protein
MTSKAWGWRKSGLKGTLEVLVDERMDCGGLGLVRLVRFGKVS